MRARPQARSGSVTCHDNHAIGLDLGATAARAAVLAVRGHDSDYARRDAEGGWHPAGARHRRQRCGHRRVGADGRAQGAVARAEGIGCRNVILGVANPQIQVRELQMPDLEPAQRPGPCPTRHGT